MPLANDDQLLLWQQEIARGEEAAFNQLFRHYYMPLLHFAIEQVKQKQAAEEIVSDVFVQLWQKKEDIVLIGKLRIFLFVAVRNRCYNYLRDHSLWKVTVSTDDVATLTSDYDPAQDLAFRELAMRIHQAVEALPEQCRQVFKLVREDGLKFREVAEILQLSPRTVETQLYRAIKKIRAAMEGPEQSATLPGLGGANASLLLLAASLEYFLGSCK